MRGVSVFLGALNEKHLRQSLQEQKASQLDEKDLPSERDVKRLIEEDPL